MLNDLKEQQRRLTENINLAKLGLENSFKDQVYWRERLEDLQRDEEDLRLLITEEETKKEISNGL